MFNTRYGEFDGDTWEIFCQKCIKLKYHDEDYQELPAHFTGDLGIEGFTRTGIVFQCYCPDENYPQKELYEHQRDKITKDLKKLIDYKDSIKKMLKNIKIEKWIFLTPSYTHKNLVEHCINKRDEYRNKKITYLSEDFDVLVYDIEFFLKEIPIVFNSMNKKIKALYIKPTEEEIFKWKDVQIDEVNNIIRKLRATFPKKIDEKTEKRLEKLVNKKRVGLNPTRFFLYNIYYEQL